MAISRREFLEWTGAGAAALTWPRWASVQDEARRSPNIVLLVADDLGYGELGAQGGKDIPTPHIDSIAKNGVRFTSGYVSCPVCSPTRAGLMTGRYQQRFGHEFNPGANGEVDYGLPLTETPLPERLRSLGYATGMVGKWHLGSKPGYVPTKRGFDEFFGFMGGGHSYLPARREKAAPLFRGTEKIEEKEYLTDAFAREAVAFIEKNRKRPFFLYLPFNAVHAPLQATDKYLTRFAGIRNEDRRKFAAMLSALDDAVGSVLTKLREASLEEDTLLFFLSDNGGPTPSTTSRNDPLRGTKSTVQEGGIRVPFFVQWKRRLPAGRVFDAPAISLDIHPTAVAAAGGAIRGEWKLDGVDLVPFLLGEKEGAPHEALFWRFGGRQRAVRKGRLKLFCPEDATPELYDVVDDPGESKDLAASRSDTVRELSEAYRAWDAQMAEPLWEGKKKKRP